MELLRARHASLVTGLPASPRTPLGVPALRHSPLFSPPNLGVIVNDGRLDVASEDRLIYSDEAEQDLPILFSDGQLLLDGRYRPPNTTLIDAGFGLSGRPDYVIRRGDGDLVPVESKSTHLFVGYHESHGRAFDVIQAIAECRLVHAAFGRRPTHGIILYCDVAGDGEHEGWVQIPYGDAEERWLGAALAQVRADGTRAPVPMDRNCVSCIPNRENLCGYAATRFGDCPNGNPVWHPHHW